MKRFLQIITLLLGLSVVGLFVFKDAIAKVALEQGMKAVTGVPLRVAGLKTSLWRGTVALRGVRLLNPRGYPEVEMLDLPELYIDLAPGQLLGGKLHIQDLHLNVAELHVIKNKDGQVNVAALKPARQAEAAKASPPKQQPTAKSRAMPFRVDRVELSIGKVIYKDFTAEPPKVQEINININRRVYTGVITNPAVLVNMVLMEALTRSALAGVVNLDIGAIKVQVKGALSEGQQLLGTAADKAGAEAEQGVTEAVDALQQLFKRD